MKYIRVFLVIVSLMISSTKSYGIDETYLHQLELEVLFMNKCKLPKKLDSITTVEESKIIKLRGQYFFAQLVHIDTNIEYINNENLNLLKQISIKAGYSDIRVMDYMRNGLKVAIII